MCDNDIDKHVVVQQWLENIFGDEPVPFYDRSDASINHLYELMSRECQVVKDAEVYKEFSSTAVQDYSDNLATAVNIANKAGLRECVESAGTDADILVSLAHTLSLSTLEENNYVLALTDLLMDREQATHDVSSLVKSVKDQTTNLSQATHMGNQLESILDKLSEQQAGDKERIKTMSRNTAFLKSKANKYKSDQKKQELKVSQSGVSRDVTHGRLVADYNELQDLTSRLQKTQEELDKFAALPPDIQLARVKLEVARAELRDLEDEIAKAIDISHL